MNINQWNNTMNTTLMSTELEEITLLDEDIEDIKQIIVYNDSVNTFNHVIDCFVNYCKHTKVQAEQLAYIIHHVGKASVKSGSLSELEPIAKCLSENNLTVEII